MSKSDLLVIGAGGHAHACIDVIEQHGRYRIAGLIGKADELHDQHLGYSVIATDDDLPQLSNNYQNIFITIGQISSPEVRIKLYQSVVDLGFLLPTIISPRAYVSKHSTIGKGTIVMHDAVINAGARVGSNCIINTNAMIEHDAIIEDHCHISTGVIANGGVHVGMGSFLGSRSVIREGVSIGQRSLIGMGVVVRHNQPDLTRYIGCDQT